jgi:hypothetical protein
MNVEGILAFKPAPNCDIEHARGGFTIRDHRALFRWGNRDTKRLWIAAGHDFTVRGSRAIVDDVDEMIVTGET